jgi:hypothetical protein
VLVADVNDRFGGVRLWIAPALGLGLVLAGLAMALGLPKLYAPFVAASVAAVVLTVGKWRTSRTVVSAPQPPGDHAVRRDHRP